MNQKYMSKIVLCNADIGIGQFSYGHESVDHLKKAGKLNFFMTQVEMEEAATRNDMQDAVEFILEMAVDNCPLSQRHILHEKVTSLVSTINEHAGMSAYLLKRTINAEAREVLLRHILDRMMESRKAFVGT